MESLEVYEEGEEMKSELKRMYMLQKFLKDYTNKSVRNYYNFDLRKHNDIYYFFMVGHHTWDIWLGSGMTIEEASKNIKVVTNCYHYEDYKKFKQQWDIYEEVKFEYKPEEILEFKSLSIVYKDPVESFYTFCDRDEANKFFKRHKNDKFHYKILQKIDDEWIDETIEY